ncbi:site-2 protease family protein [Janthinobacterium sp. Mn2066]|uniref:site-2 protease family protein n=1 Tax=Janthinobacterium sp. Mn2066 TaxID=3395264 RepID=UPI003BBFD415
MVFCARCLGLVIRSITFGIGPTCYAWGKLSLKALPFSGNLTLKDSREEELQTNECLDAFNFQPVWKQVLLPLSAPLCLLLLSMAVLGFQGWTSFLSAFAQIIDGALAPLSTAQDYLHAWHPYAATQSLLMAFALLTTKLCAFNLLPFAGLNGGQALLNLLRWGKPDAPWQASASSWLLLPGIAILASWMAALAYHFLQKIN